MKKKITRIFKKLMSSRLAIPSIFLFFFFSLAGSLVLFFEFTENDQFRNFIDGFWWSIITFSTTGYGDKYPVTIGGRIVAVITIFIGIGVMSYLSGILASVFVEQNTRARRGLMDYSKTKKHIIICGWKDNIAEVLLEILGINKAITSENLVIISNIDPEKMESLKSLKGLGDLGFVRGDYFAEAPLLQANILQAEKVLILADTLESKTASETDSKTVMTVLTIRALSKDVYISAEILDTKFEGYLRSAMCDEVVRSRDYSRMILAYSSATRGISQIFHDLISPAEGTGMIVTRPIPYKYINRSYGEYRQALIDDKNQLLLGLLENTGSPNRMKMDALREAQKTSDISKLVLNLQEVKGLQVNHPIILPAEDYIIREHSLGILVVK
ncbi:MAG: ion transporter [Spirochaetales bacterium]|nr:ion transporter [Spirochaetales bacterium]